MKGKKLDFGSGDITVNNAVIASYAGNVAVKCFGIIEMAVASVSDGIGRLIKKNRLGNGIEVKRTEDGKLILDFHVVVSYGVNIKTIAENLSNDVKYEVEKYVGKEVAQVNMFVEDVRRID